METPALPIFLGTVCLLGFLGGCTDASETSDQGATRAVIDGYTELVYQSYSDSLNLTQALKSKVDAFVAAPSEGAMQEAKQAWIAAREVYGQTEAYRFSEGPIDESEDSPEGRINAWPLDEAYIDYVKEDASGGIVNQAQSFPELSRALLMSLNERGGETNIATGWHAIEFLLWGQDFDPQGPGKRPYTDYLPGLGSTAQNQVRRGEYLKLVTELLIDDLQGLVEAWEPQKPNYAAEFRKLEPQEAVRRILSGMARLSNGELAGERLGVPLVNKDQEDEHSCFSDNTHRDVYSNALGVQNVYLGGYARRDRPGLAELVRGRDADLDRKLRAELEASVTAAGAIPAPFDRAILGDDSAEGRVKIRAAITALKAQTETLVTIAEKVFKVQIKTETG